MNTFLGMHTMELGMKLTDIDKTKTLAILNSLRSILQAFSEFLKKQPINISKQPSLKHENHYYVKITHRCNSVGRNTLN